MPTGSLGVVYNDSKETKYLTVPYTATVGKLVCKELEYQRPNGTRTQGAQGGAWSDYLLGANELG